MNALLIGVFGVYFVLTGINGNAPALGEAVKRDLPGFMPWAFALAVVLALSQYDATEKFAKPFLFLLVLNFALRNWGTISEQSGTLYNMATKAGN